MERNRELFMENAGDIFYEMKQDEGMNVEGVEPQLVTNSTAFFTIYCC